MAAKPRTPSKRSPNQTRTGATTARRKQMFLEAFANSGNINMLE